MKLLAGGCSLIYGSELQDERSSIGGFSRSTFTALLAQQLGMEYACAARPGSGSDAIARNIVAQIDSTVSLVVVGWTYFDRFEFHFSDVGWQNIRWQPGEDPGSRLPQRLRSYRHAFFGELTETYARYCYLRDMIFLQNMLARMQVPYVFCSAAENMLDAAQYYDLGSEHQRLYDQINTKHWFNWPQDQSFMAWSQTESLPIGPNGHPLELAHSRSADMLYDWINQKGIV